MAPEASLEYKGGNQFKGSNYFMTAIAPLQDFGNILYHHSTHSAVFLTMRTANSSHISEPTKQVT